ncbi:hypothetical protein BX667DRAFT_499239 [Coemansia mojavensis]|nr:hypothetical protein BX667DRAFT_499239 [Coemansia mojavensis]
MSASNLPDDVLILVLRPLLSSNIRNIWEETEYLAVCQRWRQIAVPLFYRTIHFASGRAVDTGVANSCLKRGQLEEPKSWKPETNAEMIVDMRCINLAKQLNLHINCLANPANGLTMAARFLAQFATIWPNITTLNISFYSYLNSPSPPEGYTELAFQQTHEAAHEFAYHFPNIKSLKFDRLQTQPFVHKTVAELMDRFSDTLEEACAGCGLLSSNNNVLSNLKQCSLLGESFQRHSPRMQPKTLQSLHIYRDFISLWKGNFAEDPDSGKVEFANLTDLRWISTGYFRNNGDYSVPLSILQSKQVIFPALKNLFLKLEPENWPYLNYVVFPDSLEHFTIKTYASSLQQLASVNLPKAARFTLYFYNPHELDTEEVMLVNPVLNKMAECKYIHLNLDLNSNLRADHIQSFHIHKLVLKCPIKTSELFKLIDKQPFLEVLDITSQSNEFEGMSGDELDYDLQPFKSNIKQLFFKYQHKRYTDDQAADILIRLMQRLPNLRKVVGNDLAKNKVEDFVKSSLGKYPHLANIALVFN